jgi:hypothetical protein
MGRDMSCTGGSRGPGCHLGKRTAGTTTTDTSAPGTHDTPDSGDDAVEHDLVTVTPAVTAAIKGDGDRDGTSESAGPLGHGGLGTLVVHHRDCDVSFFLDGWCAARVLAVFGGGVSRHAAGNLLVPALANTANM